MSTWIEKNTQTCSMRRAVSNKVSTSVACKSSKLCICQKWLLSVMCGMHMARHGYVRRRADLRPRAQQFTKSQHSGLRSFSSRYHVMKAQWFCIAKSFLSTLPHWGTKEAKKIDFFVPFRAKELKLLCDTLRTKKIQKHCETLKLQVCYKVDCAVMSSSKTTRHDSGHTWSYVVIRGHTGSGRILPT